MDRLNLTSVHTVHPITQFKSRDAGATEYLHIADGNRAHGGTGNCRELYAYTHPVLGMCVRATSVRGDTYDIPWHVIRQVKVAEQAEEKPKRRKAG